MPYKGLNDKPVCKYLFLVGVWKQPVDHLFDYVLSNQFAALNVVVRGSSCHIDQTTASFMELIW